ncbi:hypothetical protein FS827_22315 [Agrobacterium vitis]|uniref:hypothetical protein n=1 Tax=Allorhizobium ampelinum TaxID=3025782 RepID=UPI001F38CE48|nr:hypothetical protein [Allorhizobium ampelinum]MCF1464042.1 hypothetical protein [Allorhizobium ampelinum]
MRSFHFAVLGLLIAAGPVVAATPEEFVKRYHVDPKNAGDMAVVIDEHNNKPFLKEVDTDNDLKISKAEWDAWTAKKYVEVTKLSDEARGVGYPSTGEGILRAGARKEQRLAGIPVEALLTEEKPKPVGACEDRQQLFIRRDRLDNWMFDLVPLAKAQGASVNYTSDQQAGENNLSIDGTIGVALWRDPCRSLPKDSKAGTPYFSAFAIVPWVSAHGNRSTGDKETSDLRFGLEFQSELADIAPLNLSYFSISPYYQTDFRGDANAFGVEANWTPYWLEARLGGNYISNGDPLDWFWQFSAEADYLSVQDVGKTELKDDDYAWVGFTAKINLFPFSDSANPALADRVRITGTMKHYWDMLSGEHISDYLAEIAYNLDPSGATSISLNYENGTRKDTRADVDQVALKLNYKY